MKIANIIVKPLLLSDASVTVRAPGEIKLNAYQTIKVSPRINAQIIKRHAYLGDKVVLGQVLVTLSSVDMAEAQGQLLLASKEWKRVKKLGRKMISDSRYVTAKIEYEKAYANTKAFGMNKKEINALLAQKRSADGSFHLFAQQAGRILHDKFIVGEYVEAGFELMLIADESTLWVEARVTPVVAGQIDVDNNAEILINKQRLSAKVIQLHHSLDEITRTTTIRLEVNNQNDQLHAGMFVTTLIATRNKSKALLLPEAAVLRSNDGDWQIFVEQDEAGEFKAVEVEVKQFTDGKAIIEGIQPGTRVVTQGAFFVQSELAKGDFEIHNH
ncbi:MAG: efflux RND transporter periplasmic adaptor subunit [Proteobacteria bacterium]|nr:efflux RND transporter periplasmic adaptor subunit [Pseudomonadota bacterium]